MAESKFQIYRRSDGDFGWRLRDSNGQIVAVSSEGLGKEHVEKSVENVMAEINKDTPIVLDGSEEESGKVTRFAYFEGDDKQYWWKLQNANNNQTIASSGEGFISKSNVVRSIENVRAEISQGPQVGFEPEVKVHVTRYGEAKVDLRSMLMHPRFQEDLELLRRKKAQKEVKPSDNTASNFANKEAGLNPTR